MQKYVLIQLLEPIEEGTEFPMTNWPLHVTLAPRFVVNWESTDLFAKLTNLLAKQRPFTATAGKDEYFGANGQTQVTVIDMNQELTSLHSQIIKVIVSVNGTFDEPHYIEAGFRAHATVSPLSRLNKGDVVSFNAMTIVDMFPGGDIKLRKILKTIKLA